MDHIGLQGHLIQLLIQISLKMKDLTPFSSPNPQPCAFFPWHLVLAIKGTKNLP